MDLEKLRRRRAPIGVGLLLFVVWLGAGIRHVGGEAGSVVLDSPVGLTEPRTVGPGDQVPSDQLDR